MKSSELRGFLTGLLLGDGSIDKGVHKRSFSIKSIDKNFIDMIQNQIASCTNFKFKVTFTPQHYSSGCNHKDSWEYKIKAHPYFNKLYSYFYNDYRHKRITSNIIKWITPYGIANWYMSDGYVCLVGKSKNFITDRRIDFCTDRYTIEHITMLQNMFKNKFNISTSIIKRDKFYRLRICKDSYKQFIELISPYIIPSMQYKLYLGYNNKQEWMTDKIWNQQQLIHSAITQTDNAVG